MRDEVLAMEGTDSRSDEKRTFLIMASCIAVLEFVNNGLKVTTKWGGEYLFSREYFGVINTAMLRRCDSRPLFPPAKMPAGNPIISRRHHPNPQSSVASPIHSYPTHCAECGCALVRSPGSTSSLVCKNPKCKNLNILVNGRAE